MTILLRLLGLVVLWSITRARKRSASQLVDRASRLSTTKRTELLWDLVRDGRLPILARGLLALPAVYLFSPIDLLPDFIPFIGHFDDAALFFLAFDLAARLAPAHILDEHLRAATGTTASRAGVR
jgi:uncharacterized membrane protein YkvA (DUF1232 family)